MQGNFMRSGDNLIIQHLCLEPNKSRISRCTIYGNILSCQPTAVPMDFHFLHMEAFQIICGKNIEVSNLSNIPGLGDILNIWSKKNV